MKIKIKGQWFELSLTPIENEEQSVVENLFNFDKETLKNIETFFNENNLLYKKIYRYDYIDFKEKYDKSNILTTKKLTILFRKFAEINNYEIKDFNTMGNRYFIISK